MALFWFHAQAGLPECRLTARQSRNGARFRCISCGMEFHADINAAINVLNLGRLEMEPFPAVGRIVERQKTVR